MLDSCKYISLKLASPTVQCRDKFNALTSGTLQKILSEMLNEKRFFDIFSQEC